MCCGEPFMAPAHLRTARTEREQNVLMRAVAMMFESGHPENLCVSHSMCTDGIP
jgi:hypothetical protein